MKFGGAWWIRPVACGVGVMLGTVLLCSGLLALVVLQGWISEQWLGLLAYGAALAAAFLGAWTCGRRAEKHRLPLCALTGGIYLLLAFVLRGLMFQVVGDRPWIVPAVVLAGCVLGAVLSSGGKRRR